MHTPAGHEIIDALGHARDWWAIVFNPSFPYRLVHVLLASGLTASFLIAGLSAYRWLRDDRGEDVRAALRTAIATAALLIPLQIFVGDQHGLNTLEHQPAKIAAMEGVWSTEKGAPALLFGWPNAVTRSNDYAIGIPGLAALILTHDLDGEIRGIDEFVSPIIRRWRRLFWAFRIMSGRHADAPGGLVGRVATVATTRTVQPSGRACWSR